MGSFHSDDRRVKSVLYTFDNWGILTLRQRVASRDPTAAPPLRRRCACTCRSSRASRTRRASRGRSGTARRGRRANSGRRSTQTGSAPSQRCAARGPGRGGGGAGARGLGGWVGPGVEQGWGWGRGPGGLGGSRGGARVRVGQGGWVGLGVEQGWGWGRGVGWVQGWEWGRGHDQQRERPRGCGYIQGWGRGCGSLRCAAGCRMSRGGVIGVVSGPRGSGARPAQGNRQWGVGRFSGGVHGKGWARSQGGVGAGMRGRGTQRPSQSTWGPRSQSRDDPTRCVGLHFLIFHLRPSRNDDVFTFGIKIRKTKMKVKLKAKVIAVLRSSGTRRTSSCTRR